MLRHSSVQGIRLRNRIVCTNIWTWSLYRKDELSNRNCRVPASDGTPPKYYASLPLTSRNFCIIFRTFPVISTDDCPDHSTYSPQTSNPCEAQANTANSALPMWMTHKNSWNQTWPWWNSEDCRTDTDSTLTATSSFFLLGHSSNSLQTIASSSWTSWSCRVFSDWDLVSNQLCGVFHHGLNRQRNY